MLPWLVDVLLLTSPRFCAAAASFNALADLKPLLLLPAPQLSAGAVPSLVNLVSRLVLTSPQFAQQFIAGGGLSAGAVASLLSPTNPPLVIVDTLLIVSQLARISKESFNTYDPIHKSNIYPLLKRYGFLQSLPAGRRS